MYMYMIHVPAPLCLNMDCLVAVQVSPLGVPEPFLQAHQWQGENCVHFVGHSACRMHAFAIYNSSLVFGVQRIHTMAQCNLS